MNRVQMIESFRLTGIGVEVGVLRGEFSYSILDRSRLFLFLIDPYKHLENYKDAENGSDLDHQENKKEMLKHISIFNGRFYLFEKQSLDVVNLFEDESLDFVYLDGDHSYEYVKKELPLWYSKIKVGGILSGHDYVNNSWIGVKKAVDEFSKKHNLTINLSGEDNWKSFYIFKK